MEFEKQNSRTFYNIKLYFTDFSKDKSVLHGVPTRQNSIKREGGGTSYGRSSYVIGFVRAQGALKPSRVAKGESDDSSNIHI